MFVPGKNRRAYWIDRLIALMLIIGVFALSFACTTDRPFWGDDHAAYIAEGIAIAEGRFEEQKTANFRAHPTALYNKEVLETEKLTYVWGYPLAIAGVYKLVGYDRENFSTLPYYRAISCAALALMTGVFYLWCRRRFRRAGALWLAVFIGTCRVLYAGIDMYYSDILFWSCSVISLYLTERFLESSTDRGRILLGIMLGLMLFYTKEVRHNGFGAALCALLAFAADIRRTAKAERRRRLLIMLVPLASFLVPLVLFEGFLFGPATSDGVKFCRLQVFVSNLRYAVYTLKDWIAAALQFRPWSYLYVPPVPVKIMAYGVLAVSALGFFGTMVRKEPLYALFAVLNLISVSVLTFAQDQDGRYHYFLIPFTVLSFGYGVRMVSGWIKRLTVERSALKKFVQGVPVAAAVAVYCIAAVVCTARYGVDEPNPGDSAFSDAAADMYAYIRTNTEEDCTILTQKPRVVRLNTGRDCIAVANGHTAADADYLLDIRASWYSDTVPKELIGAMEKELVYKAKNLTLYRIVDPGNLL